MILFNFESKLVMSDKKKRRKPIIIGHLKSLMMVILKKRILKDVRMKQTKTRDHDSSRVLVRKHVDEVRTDKKHLQGTKMAQRDHEISY